MRAIWTVASKELVDLFRDRKTVVLGLLLGPLLMPGIILGTGALVESKVRTQLESTLVLPVAGAGRAPNLVAFLESRNIEVVEAPENTVVAVREQVAPVVLHIAPDYAARWRDSLPAPVELTYDSSLQDAQIPLQRVHQVLREYSATVASLRALQRGQSPLSSQAVQVAWRDVATPEARRGMLLTFLPYLLILFSFIGSAALVIDVTAGERERQSLEPLLATPAARTAIMSGKILAACLFGMLGLLLIVLAFKVSFQLAPGPLQLVDVSLPVAAQLLLVLLPMVLIGTTLLTLIAAGARSVKEAQSYLSVLMLLPIAPTLILMVNPVKNQLWQFSVPFLAQNQMLLKLIRGEVISPAEWAVYMLCGFALGLFLWLLAARLYHRESLGVSG
ncbi:ABC transporter permease [Parahaliea aestuarii]|uniref:ABC transporter permease n=1 Tax=Parahaliea aestuarii TaxID=1852021 RepID=A0A5C8ZRI3_9GAMM|nr:ABC transporter permease [Parahaliea aestuarii]TXS90975.1 ABC transporter permease [Parahaliea aestuarii]